MLADPTLIYHARDTQQQNYSTPMQKIPIKLNCIAFIANAQLLNENNKYKTRKQVDKKTSSTVNKNSTFGK